MLNELRTHQIEALGFYIANPKCADLSDPGTGKTGPACVYIEYLYKHQGSKSLWSMPKALLKKNKAELHAFTNLKDDEVIIVDGTPKQREKQMQSPNAVVFLMGFKRFTDDWKTLVELHPTINSLLVDEIHMGGYKNPTTKNSQALTQFMRKRDYFLAMSGTLIDGRLDSCYVPINTIEPRYYANHRSFMAQHALLDNYGNLLAWINHEKLGRIFMRHCFRRTFEQVYGKEAKVIIKELVAMDEKSRLAYNEFAEKAFLELENEFLDGVNPAVNAMRCRQIMGHPHTMGLLKEGELTGKDEAILVHLEDHINTGKPLVIFSSLQPEQERIVELCKKAGLRVGLINGNVSDKGKVDELFRAGKLDVIVGSPATAAVGFNWGHVDHVIFASIDYQDVNFVQAYRRCIRGKRKICLRITILEYENSIDQRIFAIVDKKSRDKSKVDSTYETLSLSAKGD